jgi:hypothetical protein
LPELGKSSPNPQAKNIDREKQLIIHLGHNSAYELFHLISNLYFLEEPVAIESEETTCKNHSIPIICSPSFRMLIIQ